LIVGLCWLFLDALWQHQLNRQSAETRYLFAGKSHREKLLADWDADYFAFAEAIKTRYLPEDVGKVPLLAVPGTPKEFGFRVRYHLMPDIIADIHGYSDPEPGSNVLTPITRRTLERGLRRGQYLILLTPPQLKAVREDPLASFDASLSKTVERVFANDAAALYRKLPDAE
jgi:hypothetical protein